MLENKRKCGEAPARVISRLVLCFLPGFPLTVINVQLCDSVAHLPGQTYRVYNNLLGQTCKEKLQVQDYWDKLARTNFQGQAYRDKLDRIYLPLLYPLSTSPNPCPWHCAVMVFPYYI